MVEPVPKWLTSDGDSQFVGDRKVGKSLPPSIMTLGKEHLLFLAMQRLPLGDTAFKGAAYGVGNLVRPLLFLEHLEDGDGHNTGDRLEHLLCS